MTKFTDQIPADVKAAIEVFLHECQKEARPLVMTGIVGAMRGMFPALNISDARLEAAVALEASAAGFGACQSEQRERTESDTLDGSDDQRAANISEDEDEALDSGSRHQQYGRRIERDGSWTIYHVFTGSPARISGHSMVGLSRPGATELMTFLNAHNEERRDGS